LNPRFLIFARNWTPPAAPANAKPLLSPRENPKRNPRKPGRKGGDAYGQHTRRPVPDHMDETHDASLPLFCPHCHGAIQEEAVQDQFQEDIPPIRPLRRRFRVHVGRCQNCGRRVQGRHPLQTSDALGAAAVQFGPSALSTATQMNKELGVPYGKIALFFQTTFFLTAARASFCRSNLRLASKAQPTYHALVLALRHAVVVYGDETGWKISGWPAWLWAFATMHFTVYFIRRSRGSDVVLEALGLEFSGLLGRDGWKPWRILTCQAQSCLAHHLERCRELHQDSLAGQARFPLAVKNVLKDALALRDRRNKISAHGFTVARGRLEARMDRLISGQYTHEPNARFARHLTNERPALFTFLHHPKIEATNWPAEQAIRPAVVNRKTSGGNRSDAGAQAQAVLTTIFRSARQQGRNPVTLLVRLLHAQTPLDLGLARTPVTLAVNSRHRLPLPRAQPA
jgi:transposase